MDKVSLTVDGKTITVERGTTVLQAAIQNGIQIPYYCYHPALGVDGSCRVCIVKVEKMPKLQTACSTICADGMVVDTKSPEVVEARAGVFEFLLINHPLDCPVCDKGGECPLQDYSYDFGREQSRMDFPRRVFDGEGVAADVDFGPTLMLNRNRCILCTRCVRFMRDIDGDAQISIVDRGYGSQIATFEEAGVHSILSGNLMDVCPVGAITTRDYRFKSRPWDNLQAVDTVCTFCSKGCSTTVWIKAKKEWAKGPRLIRVTPRLNPEVNGYWMCDIGRFDYHWMEAEGRLRRPLVRQAGEFRETGWHDLMVRLREKLLTEGGARPSPKFLVSAHASLEELFLVREMAGRLARGDAADLVTVSWRHRVKSQPGATTFRVPAVDAPDVAGARDLSLTTGDPSSGLADVSGLRRSVEAGEVPALYVYDPGPEGSIGDLSWVVEARTRGKLPTLIVHGVLMTELARAADLVLPGAAAFEKDACYTNDQGRVQAAARVTAPPGDAMEDWQVFVSVAATLGVPLTYGSAAAIREAIVAEMAGKPEYVGLPSLVFAKPVVVGHWLQASNPSERLKWDALFKDAPPTKFGKSDAPGT
jgi:NADH-quinone oxidoreductase subunit G